MEYEIEDGDDVRLKNERTIMFVKEIDNEMALCSFHDEVNKEDKEEWIKVNDLVLVKKSDDGFVK